MCMMFMQRSFLLFSNTVHEQTTLDHYVWELNEFIRFYNCDKTMFVNSKSVNWDHEIFYIAK